MNYTLLDMVQRILEAMESDEVNNYDDTPESLAVANIIKEVYYDIISTLDIPEHYTMFQLNASGSSSYPVVMTLPSDIRDLIWMKYNAVTSGETESNFELVQYLDPPTFIDRMHRLNTGDTNVDSMSYTVNGDAFEFKYFTDRQPYFYTVFEDSILIFDGYDSSVDSTLQKSKTSCYGRLIPTFTLANTFTPNLDAGQMQLLLQEAKSQAFYELKQMPNQKAEGKARRAWINANKRARNVPVYIPAYSRYPNYGRKK